MDSSDCTLRGVSTIVDSCDGAPYGVDWLAVASPGRAVLYVTPHDTGVTTPHVFSDPGELRGAVRMLEAIRRQPRKVLLQHPDSAN